MVFGISEFKTKAICILQRISWLHYDTLAV